MKPSKLNKYMNKFGKVFLIRHGSTDFNKEGGTSADRIRGWANVPLNDQGREDADKAAKKLSDENPSKIFASDLIRAEETAHILDKEHNAPIILSTNLRPWGLGDLEGKQTKDVEHIMDHYIKSPDEVVPNGESFNTFKNRYLNYLQQIIQKSLQDKNTYFVVCHLRNVKAYLAWEHKGFPENLDININDMINDVVDPGAVIQVKLDKFLDKI